MSDVSAENTNCSVEKHKKYKPFSGILDIPTPLSSYDIFEIEECAGAIEKVFNVTHTVALNAALSVKEEELGRELSVLRELIP